MASILLIEDKPSLLDYFHKSLVPPHKCHHWPDGTGFESLLNQKDFEVILLDIQLGRKDAFNLLNQIRVVSPHTPVLAISEVEETSLVVRAVKEGAFDFIGKPFSKEKIDLSVQRAMEARQLRNEIDYLRRQQDVIYDFDRIIAKSPAMSRIMGILEKFAATDSTILITGETGTGKSFLSGTVHFNSSRRNNPFITINCANISETLLESELFGHEKGAFTGANKTRIGRLEQGRGGSVFLDEIGEMSPPLQAKLLRVLEDKSFERVGGNRTIYSDVRIIAATNKDPEEQVAQGRLREDLYYRINVLRVHLPPLRERTQCIEPLANHLLRKSLRNLKKRIEGFAPEALKIISEFPWPGNIRQLANTIERSAILEESSLIHADNIILPEPTYPGRRTRDNSVTPVRSLGDQEKQTILEALEESLWVQKDAAVRLGITPRALNYKIKKYGITHTRWRKHR